MNTTSPNILAFILILFVQIGMMQTSCAPDSQVILLPELPDEVIIDGHLEEWKEEAFTEGIWNLERVKQAPWYFAKKNRLVRHAGEDSATLDLEAEYYLAWRGDWLYIGAEVKDNVNDVMDTLHEPKRWYYKDAIALFIEAPRDSVSEKFAEGDHAFCFVIDPSYPDYGAWWRHGSMTESYIEEPITSTSVEYRVHMQNTTTETANYTLEARVHMPSTIGAMELGGNGSGRYASYGLMIVHCDPDGGEYGGHLLIYGKGDDDQTWTPARFEKRSK
jgi:hypothetical protein